ncbi:hypothetical protein AGLY_005406 [Aphis glycines]|uniref:Uncharacterized protein n=1 Tax=Aphis glycines TaxID=307491 RepID=A0A6G0TUB8_APHGL|nr:hypothetical protein AGLY_005406 [Aphis glycines]
MSSKVNSAGTCLYPLFSLVAHASDMKEKSSAKEKNEETVIWWQDSRELLWMSKAWFHRDMHRRLDSVHSSDNSSLSSSWFFTSCAHSYASIGSALSGFGMSCSSSTLNLRSMACFHRSKPPIKSLFLSMYVAPSSSKASIFSLRQQEIGDFVVAFIASDHQARVTVTCPSKHAARNGVEFVLVVEFTMASSRINSFTMFRCPAAAAHHSGGAPSIVSPSNITWPCLQAISNGVAPVVVVFNSLAFSIADLPSNSNCKQTY